MSTINPPTDAASANMGLKIALTVLSTLGFGVWGTSIGFMLGWEHGAVFLTAGFAEQLSVVSNAAMIYITARILFLVMDLKFPNEASLQDLHQCVARLVAFTILGFTTFVDSVVWLGDKETTYTLLYHLCNYGFVISAVVAGLAGGLLRVTAMRTALPFTVEAPRYAAQSAQYPQSHQGPHSQYSYTNQAYVQHYPQQRM